MQKQLLEVYRAVKLDYNLNSPRRQRNPYTQFYLTSNIIKTNKNSMDILHPAGLIEDKDEAILLDGRKKQKELPKRTELKRWIITDIL